jgi:Flp pilus assembly protein TadG
MTSARCKHFEEDSGQSLVEFAMLAPLFLFLLIGMFEFGRAWNIYQVVVNAAREGGRVAALPIGFANADSVTTRVTTYLMSAGLDTGTAVVTMDDVDGPPGTIATVGVSYPYSFTFVGPLAQMFAPSASLGGDIVLSSTINMRNE